LRVTRECREDIHGHAGCFADAVNGSYSNIVGLPLAETVLMLRGMGYGC
jgi:predicted house-cleaning NTP pyrophosphatase (Maf/HAM1 superfamily)